MKVIAPENGIPIKMWLHDMEDGALQQAANLARLPFAFKHIAIMPDAHRGYGMPIGGVLATKGVVVPNAVGVDIGCGVVAVRTSLTAIKHNTLLKLVEYIKNKIPVGHKHNTVKNYYDMPHGASSGLPIVTQEYLSAAYQLGTLGGGNHFIEIQKADDGHIWIMLHSGSRNLGYKVANHYNKVAVRKNKEWYTDVPKEWELAFLPIDSSEGILYLKEMNYCVAFAKANREVMLRQVMRIFDIMFNGIEYDKAIDVAHNYATMENHFGSNVLVHRKGATRAQSGEYGIIPGNQGDSSFIVRGIGNRDSFTSCSHGAGRVLGRKEAKRVLSLKDEQEHLNAQGIIHSVTSEDKLDEASGAYKDIHTVMCNQKDLVVIGVELKPLAVIKG